MPREVRTLEDKREWLRRQVAPVLAMVADAARNSNIEILQLLQDGRQRYMRRRDRVALVELARLDLCMGEAAD